MIASSRRKGTPGELQRSIGTILLDRLSLDTLNDPENQVGLTLQQLQNHHLQEAHETDDRLDLPRDPSIEIT
jgi:hypothetical protein